MKETHPKQERKIRSRTKGTRQEDPDHSGQEQPRIHTAVLGHSLVRWLVRSLAHFAHSRARGTVNDWMAIYSVFFSILNHSAEQNSESRVGTEKILT